MFFLLFPTQLFSRFQFFVQIVGKHRACRRVIRPVPAVALKGFFGEPQGSAFHKHPTVLDGEEHLLFPRKRTLRYSKGAVIIEDVKTATEGGQYQIAFPALDIDIAHGDDRQPPL